LHSLEHPNKTKGRLKATLIEECKGVKHVNLFVDHVSPDNVHNIPSSAHTISDYLRRVLAPVACPLCHSKKMSMSHSGDIKERLIKIVGRRVFRCDECGAQLIVKMHRWEWEIVGAVLAIIAVLLLFSMHWILK